MKRNLKIFSFSLSCRQVGVSLLEALIGGTILAAVIVMIAGSYQQLKKRQRYVITQQTKIWAINHLVEQVKSMVALRPNPGGAKKSMEEALDDFKVQVTGSPDTTMPIVWSHRRIESSQPSAKENLALCPTCIGRMGYDVQPLNNFPGYVLTIAISHPEIFLQQEDKNKKKTDIIVYKQFVLGSS